MDQNKQIIKQIPENNIGETDQNLVDQRNKESNEEPDFKNGKSLEENVNQKNDANSKNVNEEINNYVKNTNSEKILALSKNVEELPKQTEKNLNSNISNNESFVKQTFEKEIKDEIVLVNNEKQNDKLIFTFKDNRDKKDNFREINYAQENNYPTDYSYIMETEQNLKLFEKKFQEFQKNTVLHSSLQKDVGANFSKFEEPLKESYEKNYTRLEQKNECLHCKITIDNLVMEKNNYLETIKKMKKSEEIYEEKIDRYLKEIENLFEENKNKEKQIRKNLEESYLMKRNYDALRKELVNKTNLATSWENSYNKLYNKFTELEYKNTELEKKGNHLEYKFKSLKIDYENIMKTSLQLKKEKERLINIIDEIKSNKHSLEQENLQLRSSLSKNEKQIQSMNKEIAFISNPKQRNASNEERNFLFKTQGSPKNIYRRDSAERDNKIRSASGGFNKRENRNKELNKNQDFSQDNQHKKTFEFDYNPHRREHKTDENILSELLLKKSHLENEMLKLPNKQKNLNQINRKILLDEEMNQIENEINNYRNKLKSAK